MTQVWSYTEKALAITQLLAGLALIILFGQTLKSLFDLFSATGMLSSFDQKVNFLFVYQTYILIPLLALFNGWKLFEGKKIGWLMTISLLMFRFLWGLSMEHQDKQIDELIGMIAIEIILLILLLAIFQKPFRDKYRFSKPDCLIIGPAVICLLLGTIMLP